MRCTCPSSRRMSSVRLPLNWTPLWPCLPEDSASTHPSSFVPGHCKRRHAEVTFAYNCKSNGIVPWDFGVSVLSHFDRLHLQELFVGSQNLPFGQIGQLRVFLKFLIGEGTLALPHGSRSVKGWLALRNFTNFSTECRQMANAFRDACIQRIYGKAAGGAFETCFLLCHPRPPRAP